MKKLFKKIAGFDRKKTINLQQEEEMPDTEELYEDDVDKEMAEEMDEDDGALEDEEQEWLGEDYEEGQLSIDVYQTPKELVVKSTIAGVKPDDIDISINNDMLTIRGKREQPDNVKDENYLYRECYWGSFSRSIILPVEIEPDKIEACLENGVLSITLPKAKSAKEITIKVKEK